VAEIGLGVPPVTYSPCSWPRVLTVSSVIGSSKTEIGVTNCVDCTVDWMFQLDSSTLLDDWLLCGVEYTWDVSPDGPKDAIMFPNLDGTGMGYSELQIFIKFLAEIITSTYVFG
jgi:hypothetical protein